MDETMNIYEKLSHIQNELKAPKNQHNDFGNYNYRSCEDILEALKPICNKYKTTLILCDEIQMIGDRTYVMAISTLVDWESESKICSTAYARESVTKKGMDDSQVTGSTSSYARKYSLNGLFNIDDTKDEDGNEMAKEKEKELEKLSINYGKLRSKMEELKIDFRSVSTEEWIFEKANINTQELQELSIDELTRLNKAYRTLIKGKEDKMISDNNDKVMKEAGGF